jgi:RNA polymerase sigma-70 factor (ECF subfamily)
MASLLDSVDDLGLIESARRGEAAAFGEIVRRYEDRIFNTIYRLVGDWQDAKDLTQQTFLKAYESMGTFRGGSRFYTWLYRIGVNAALDERKKQSRSPGFLSDSFDLSSAEDGRSRGGRSTADDPADGLISRETEAAVMQAIRSLDEMHRAVVVLRDIEGLDYDEIAEALECPRGTVKSRLHRARIILREKLKDVV